jgi:hypothetical protein
MYRRRRTGYLPFSYVHGEEYRPYEISETFLENTHWASRLHSKSMWESTDDDLIRGYNHIVRGVGKKYIFVIGVVRDKEYKQLTLRVTHSRTQMPEGFLGESLTDMDYHLSLVLWPWKKDPNSENYVPALCSPRNCLAFNITDVNRKKRTVSAAVSGIYYDGIAPPHLYDTGMIANMLHSDFGSSVIKRYEPEEGEYEELSSPITVKFGTTREYDKKRMNHKRSRKSNKPYTY